MDYLISPDGLGKAVAFGWIFSDRLFCYFLVISFKSLLLWGLILVQVTATKSLDFGLGLDSYLFFNQIVPGKLFLTFFINLEFDWRPKTFMEVSRFLKKNNKHQFILELIWVVWGKLLNLKHLLAGTESLLLSYLRCCSQKQSTPQGYFLKKPWICLMSVKRHYQIWSKFYTIASEKRSFFLKKKAANETCQWLLALIVSN